ncbi:MAG: glycosyltransferase [Clostridia bacterium]|jgi:glycosyltransferase involved in cell wall biosynthesis|nr:glycosyltransferase [Clostridia bacterium]
MKILFIDFISSPNASNKFDGSVIHQWELVQNLLALGNEIHVLSEKKNNNHGYGNLFFHKLQTSTRFKRLNYSLSLIKIISAYNFDILYTRTPASLNGYIGFLAKKLWRKTLIFEINGIAFQEQAVSQISSKHNSHIIKILRKIRKKKELFIWNKADALIVVTNQIKQFLISYGVCEKKINVILNGANTNLFKPMKSDLARKELGFNNQSPFVCFVGNLVSWQGLNYLIDAAEIVCKSKNVTFLIVGEGPLKKELLEQVHCKELESNFIFTGRVPYEQVPVYINASDLCVVPKIKSLSSGYSPLKLYEYMACAKPVIATNTEGFEILNQINSGITVNTENSTEFANAIVYLLENKHLSLHMGDNGLAYVNKEHSWETVASKSMDVFTFCLRR